MVYSYQNQRPRIFTEDGMRMLLAMRDEAIRLVKASGAVQMSKLMSSGDAWDMLACADYLVEQNVLHEITDYRVPRQHRVFVQGSAFPA